MQGERIAQNHGDTKVAVRTRDGSFRLVDHLDQIVGLHGEKPGAMSARVTASSECQNPSTSERAIAESFRKRVL